MKNKVIIIAKLILSVFLSLLWFLLVQAEYEMITKPLLQNDFPVIKGVAAIWFLGLILLILGAAIIFLLRSIKKYKKI
jgi:hypothetical protein